MLLLKNLLFTLLVPGTTAGLIPYWVLTHGSGDMPSSWGILQVLGLALALPGVLIYLCCVWDFATEGRGTPAPIDPPRSLVVRGLYRYVRNPMYLGVLLVLMGEVLFFESGALLLYVVLWFSFVHLFVVLYEEPALRRRFEGSYQQYCRAVHRWVPGAPYRPPAFYESAVVKVPES